MRDKGIGAAGESSLEGAGGGGEIGGIGQPCDIGVARGIDRYAVATSSAAAAQVGGVEQGRAGGVQFGDKGIAAAGRSSLEGARGGGEIGGAGTACDIGVARGIDRYADAVVIAAAAQVGGVEQGRAGGVQLADKGIVVRRRK